MDDNSSQEAGDEFIVGESSNSEDSTEETITGVDPEPEPEPEPEQREITGDGGTSGTDNVQDDGGAEGDGGNADEGATLPGDDSQRSSDDGGSSGESEGENILSAGDTVADESNEQVYQGVTADDFQAYCESVEAHMTAQFTMCVVILFAVFVCAGICAVETLLRSTEKI